MAAWLFRMELIFEKTKLQLLSLNEAILIVIQGKCLEINSSNTLAESEKNIESNISQSCSLLLLRREKINFIYIWTRLAGGKSKH